MLQKQANKPTMQFSFEKENGSHYVRNQSKNLDLLSVQFLTLGLYVCIHPSENNTRHLSGKPQLITIK